VTRSGYLGEKPLSLVTFPEYRGDFLSYLGETPAYLGDCFKYRRENLKYHGDFVKYRGDNRIPQNTKPPESLQIRGIGRFCVIYRTYQPVSVRQVPDLTALNEICRGEVVLLFNS
jgi:hypothetical protein